MQKDIILEISDILATSDLLSKALKLAGLITRVFREAGWDLVVVGGSAVCLKETTLIDWNEVERLAACPSFDVLKETSQLRQEVVDELKK